MLLKFNDILRNQLVQIIFSEIYIIFSNFPWYVYISYSMNRKIVISSQKMILNVITLHDNSNDNNDIESIDWLKAIYNKY